MLTDDQGQFCRAAADIAMRAALEYGRVHRLAFDTLALADSLKASVKAAMPAALADAKAAVDAGMVAIGSATFASSMTLAGIDAAKEAAVRPAGLRIPAADRTFTYDQIQAAAER